MPTDNPLQPDPSGGDAAPRPRRRERYRGTHPRRFEQRYKEHSPAEFPEMQDHIRAQGRTPAGTHVPIMLAEIVEQLALRPGDIVCDATLGYGGHAGALIDRIGSTGRFVGLDVDASEAPRTAERLDATYYAAIPNRADAETLSRCVIRTNFAGIAKVAGELAPDGFDAILADLGVSSMQLDDPRRGFSYKHDGPLDMRMDTRRPRTAADLLNALPRQALCDALRDLADEPAHAAIADEIIRARAEQPFQRTSQLTEAVMRATRSPRDAAARTFQALRMLVNDEAAALREFLRVVPQCLRPGGRVAILTFHSGEDRLVKRAFRDGVATGLFQTGDLMLTPRPAEVYSNPRARSAKLRVARKSSHT